MKLDIDKLKQKKSVKELLEFGIINIDKSSGPTSFNVSDFVSKTLGLRKTSHFGTLDPKVTGVLPVALNRGCKLTGFFIGEDKVYVGIMRIHEDVELKVIKKMIKDKFTGKIIQLPPDRSRVKRQHREREVKKFKILEKDGQDILFEVECQGGTYIRKLVSDLGDELGIGAHMLELRRMRAGIFEEDDSKYPSINLYNFVKAVEDYEKGDEKDLRKIIIPGEIVSVLHPVVQVKEEYVDKLFHGSPIVKEYLSKAVKIAKDKTICVFSGDRFIGLYTVINKGEIVAKSDFVLQPIK